VSRFGICAAVAALLGSVAWASHPPTVRGASSAAHCPGSGGCALVMVLGRPRGLQIIAYRPAMPRSFRLRAGKSVTLGNSKTVAWVVGQVNGLPEVSNGVTACGADAGSYDSLRFLYPNGDRWTVIVETQGCPSVHFPGGHYASVDSFLLLALARLVGT
jgi:hypothetical protein